YSPHRERLYVKITSDDGHVGWGEGGATGAAVLRDIVQDFLIPQLLGQDPMAVEYLWAEMRRSMWDRGGATGFFAEAMAAVDLALWDLKGHILDQPVYALAGGPFTTRIPTYQSGIQGSTPEERAASARDYVDQGVKAIKLHLT